MAALNGSLPGDWPALERALSAASALTASPAQHGARLLVAGLQQALDAARSTLSGGGGSNGTSWDEDDQAYASDLLEAIDSMERNLQQRQQQQAGGGRQAAASAGAAAGRQAHGAAEAAQPGQAADEQPEIVMLGPAKTSAAGMQAGKSCREAGKGPAGACSEDEL